VNDPLNSPIPDIIPEAAAATFADLLLERIRRTPDGLAYREYDPVSETWLDTCWRDFGREVARWRVALQGEGLEPGERVAIQLRNSRAWACFELAAQSLGLVTVPLYTNDRPSNLAYILEHADSRLLLIDDGQAWQPLREALSGIDGLKRILSVKPVRGPDGPTALADWLPDQAPELQADQLDPDALASIVYTSGTTGRAKGVMLSHRNILWNVRASLAKVEVYPDDLFLSFLPLSHTLERMAGFYLPMAAGAGVAFARSIAQLAEDLQSRKPTILIAVPRIFERVYGKLHDKIDNGPAPARALFNKAVELGWQHFEHQQGRGPDSSRLLRPLLDGLVGRKLRRRLGGRLRFAVSGGAPLSEDVARLFIGLGVPIVQGYGLTETSPVIAANSLLDNVPASVGTALEGVEVKIGDQDELLTRSPSVMSGYWKNPDATAAAIDPQGWLGTGDQVRMDGQGHIFITGRLKEIIVLANGEKLPPGDMETAIALDPLFEQVLVLGEARPCLTALIVPRAEAYGHLLEQLKLPADTGYAHPKVAEAVLERVAARLHEFPGYARITRARLLDTSWSIDNGLMTPTMKLRRKRILERYATEVEELYKGNE